MPTNSGAIAELLAPDLRRVYVDTGKERPLEYPLYFNVEDMEWNPLTDQQVSGLGTLPGKDEGEQFTMDDILMGSTKTYTAAPFGMAVEITWEAWRDELYGIMREMVRELARASRNRQDADGSLDRVREVEAGVDDLSVATRELDAIASMLAEVTRRFTSDDSTRVL